MMGALITLPEGRGFLDVDGVQFVRPARWPRRGSTIVHFDGKRHIKVHFPHHAPQELMRAMGWQTMSEHIGGAIGQSILSMYEAGEADGGIS